MSRFDDYLQRARARHGERFIPPTDPRFIDAYNKGDKFRIKVRATYPSGHTHERWGFVGITTGWAPAFLLMARRGQHGSSDLLCKDDEIIESRYLA